MAEPPGITAEAPETILSVKSNFSPVIRSSPLIDSYNAFTFETTV